MLLMLITLTGSLDGAIKYRENFLEEVFDMNDVTNMPVQGYDYYPVQYPVEYKQATTTTCNDTDTTHNENVTEEEEHIEPAPAPAPAPAPMPAPVPVKRPSPPPIPTVAPYSGSDMSFAPF